MTLLLSTLWAQAARDWNPPSGNQYPSHAVVYATLFDASGQEVDNVADMRVGAFIDGECRAAANPVVRETPNGGRYIYTLRIGVNDADKGKKVQFVLQDIPGNEYVLPETITVTGGDETVGGVPSNPFHLTFTPITAINGPSELPVRTGVRTSFTIVKLLQVSLTHGRTSGSDAPSGSKLNFSRRLTVSPMLT